MRSGEGILPGMTPLVWMRDDSLVWIADLKAKGYDIAKDEVFRPQDGYPGAEGRGPTFAPARYRAEDSNTAFLISEAIKYLSVHDQKPWFVHISYLAPHPPFVVPEPYHAMYDPAEVPPPLRAASPEDEAPPSILSSTTTSITSAAAVSASGSTPLNITCTSRRRRCARPAPPITA